MNNIVSWEYYSSLYNNLTEDEFPAAEANAERILRQEIGPIKWSGITENIFGYVALQDCICNVINKLAEDKKAGVGSNIASASNDGYTETYAIKTEDEQHAQLKLLIRIWLSGTGMIGAY